MNYSPIRAALLVALWCAASLWPARTLAWGDEGHGIIALIADHYLAPRTRDRVAQLLAGDNSGLVADRSIAAQAAWADRYRDSDRNGTRDHYASTRQWHYVDIELDAPDLDAACLGHPPLPPQLPASKGAASACIVDKLEQFMAELSDPHTMLEERRLALQFVLHLVGDLHQPLHAGDRHDQGGNSERVEAAGLPDANLHRYWDLEFVQAFGPDPRVAAESLVRQISASDIQAWQRGSPASWARESFSVAKNMAFGMLPPPVGTHRYRLSPEYVHAAQEAVRLQLQRAGVRLAWVLNQSLS